jgi:hypothetical protein
MAIAQFNPLYPPLRGKIGGLVFKHYTDKVVVTRAPTFSGQWSTAQQDERKRFALASAYARAVCAEPVLRAKYEKIAAQRRLTIRSAAISAYLQGKTAEIENPPPTAHRRPGRARPHHGFPPLKSGYKPGREPTPVRTSARAVESKLRITAKDRAPPAGRRTQVLCREIINLGFEH